MKRNETPTDLVAAASQVKAEQCQDEEKVEQRNNYTKELEPSSNQIPVQPDELRCGYRWGSEGSAFGHYTIPEPRER